MKIVKYTRQEDLDFFKKMKEKESSRSFGFELNKNIEKLNLFAHFPYLTSIEYSLVKIEELAKIVIQLIENESIALDILDYNLSDSLIMTLIPSSKYSSNDNSFKIYNFINNLLYYKVIEFKTYPMSLIKFDEKIYESVDDLYMSKEETKILFNKILESELLEIFNIEPKFNKYVFKTSKNYDEEFKDMFFENINNDDEFEYALNQAIAELSKYLKVDLLLLDLIRNQICISFYNDEKIELIEAILAPIGGFKLIKRADFAKKACTSFINQNFIILEQISGVDDEL